MNTTLEMNVFLYVGIGLDYRFLIRGAMKLFPIFILLYSYFFDGCTVNFAQLTEEAHNGELSIYKSLREFEDSYLSVTSLGIVARMVAFVFWKSIPDHPVFTPFAVPLTPESMEFDWWRLWSPAMWLQNSSASTKIREALRLHIRSLKAAQEYFIQCEAWNVFLKGMPFGVSSSPIPLENNKVYIKLLKSYDGRCGGDCRTLMDVPASLRIPHVEEWSKYIDYQFLIRILFFVNTYTAWYLIDWFEKQHDVKKASLHKEEGDKLLASCQYDSAATQYKMAIELDNSHPEWCDAVSNCHKLLQKDLRSSLYTYLSTRLDEDFTSWYMINYALKVKLDQSQEVSTSVEVIPVKNQDLKSVKKIDYNVDSDGDDISISEEDIDMNSYSDSEFLDEEVLLPHILSQHPVNDHALGLMKSVSQENLKKEAADAFSMGNTDEHINDIDSDNDLIPGDDINVDFDSDSDDYGIPELKEAIREWPELMENIFLSIQDPDNYYALGLLKSVSQEKLKKYSDDAFSKGNTDEALHLYREALSVDAGDYQNKETLAQLHDNCAVIYSKTGQDEEAAEASSSASLKGVSHYGV